MTFKVGDKVIYKPNNQKGIIKSLAKCIDDRCAWVVYSCGGDWENYQNYTGAVTFFSDLKLGWEEEVMHNETVGLMGSGCGYAEHYFNEDGSTTIKRFDNKRKLVCEHIFKKRTNIELDRLIVEDIMKKMASEGREDLNWERIFGKTQYDIQMNFDMRVNIKVLFTINCNTEDFYYIGFNKVYFFTEQDAQKCLDFLLEKYGESRLKEIWGVK